MSTEQQTVADVQPTPEDPRVTARNLVHRFLGNPTGQAQNMVDQLDDAEVTAIVAAGQDRDTARDAIKGVFASAYDRRQAAHHVEAVSDQKRLEARAAATRTLIANGFSQSEANLGLIPILSTGEQLILATLEGERDVKDVVAAVVDRAKQRYEEFGETVNAAFRGDADKVTKVSTDDGSVEPAWPAEAEKQYAEGAASDVNPGELKTNEPAAAEPTEPAETPKPSKPHKKR